MSNSAFSIFMSQVRNLGDSTQRLWQQCDFNENQFSEICYTKLQEFSRAADFNLENLLEDLVLSGELSGIQKNHFFSQMQVTLYQEENFFIELLNWTEGSTSTHDHSFSGAFLVLQGTSFHSSYKFEKIKVINSRLHVGNLLLNQAEILRTGSVREIKAGGDFVHSVFHLSLPTCTLVIRTNIEKNYLPQLDYKGQHIAHAPDHVTFKQKHIIQSLSVAKSWGEEYYEAFFKKILISADVESLIIILNKIIHEVDSTRLSIIKNILNTHDLGDLIFSSFLEERGKRNCSKLKTIFKKENERLLMAAIIFLKNRKDIFKFYEDTYKESWEIELKPALNALLTMSPVIDKKLVETYSEMMINGKWQEEVLLNYSSWDEVSKFLFLPFIQDGL